MTGPHRFPTGSRNQSGRLVTGSPPLQGEPVPVPIPDNPALEQGNRSRDRCDKCWSSFGEIVRLILRSGATQLRWRCDACGRICRQSLPHAGRRLEDYPVARDDRRENPPCERCGSMGAEYHHWPPVALFEDAWDWPGDYLCPLCHRRWHVTTGTNGRQREESA